jgi:hypothetical protein
MVELKWGKLFPEIYPGRRLETEVFTELKSWNVDT